ncbi:hypothetical protein EV192_1011194 [Actinocrispum wychmicini]|uniref:Uncharacterized protein n=1 Tax=Actinocrispum wychmicini TaxID=1213861 RepID=A0A4R2K169_9PSEU|nr:hypothetical protein EV192_1011194 [Actinocrispum wychmicini]
MTYPGSCVFVPRVPAAIRFSMRSNGDGIDLTEPRIARPRTWVWLACSLSRPTWAKPNHTCQEVRLRKASRAAAIRTS